MTELTQFIIDTYKTRQQLIQNGIWRGELYKHIKIINSHDRSWIWKTLLLHSENQEDINDNDHNNNNNNNNNNNRYITNESQLFDSLNNLVAVPLISAKPTSQNEKDDHDHDDNNNNNISLPFTPIKRMVQIGSKGIRKLTPKETHSHPLATNKNVTESSNNNDEDYGMDISDTLEIIDLDLSRLIVSPIFEEPQIHALMRRIMFNYLLLDNKKTQKDISIMDQTYRYRQGFHEILAIIFLQFYDSQIETTEISNNNEQIKFVLFIFTKLMVPLQSIFYIENRLLEWQDKIFIKVLKLSSPQLFSILYPKPSSSCSNKNSHNNLIWLIRWTRLLFLRELPLQDCLIIWDHILTFSYPLDSMVACLIVSILITVRKTLVEIHENDEMDNDDLIEFMLQFDKRVGVKRLDILKICELAGLLCESWESGHWKDLSRVVIRYINQNEMDPNRKRLEDKLKQRVQRSMIK
ncbi:similar to Saccharomyces cerevisiae YJL044C GYP6 GTPase-activating protein (GAP) for the yeast Rab family member, Ypt6p [Maudiozyma barnettii]|nr:similar to Saccharomyces cerevisiae YJL044C GYP6 GTPase-activating protein (GAP) for the yeast Rab family member, Ypt6p [Kazachstania barnettii]